MVWLILNILLMLILMAMYQILSPSNKESHIIELIFGICLIGFVFFSILGLQQTKVVEELLKRMTIIEVIAISLASVAIVLRKKSRG